MAEHLAELFAVIKADSRQFDLALSNVKRSLENVKGHFDKLSGYAKYMFAGLAAGAVFATKSIMDQEQADIALKSALSATGQEVDGNLARLKAYAATLQTVTVFSDDAIQKNMALALNMGVTADQMESVTQAAIGLANSFFGGNLEAGFEAVAKAMAGDFMMLQRTIPALRALETNQEKFNLVLQKGAEGFKQAQENSNSLSGNLKKLWNSIGEVGEAFGAVLAPQIGKAVAWLSAASRYLQALSPEMTAQIVSWLKWAAAIAAVVAFGPSVASFVSTCVGMIGSLAKAAVVLAVNLVSLLVSLGPVGLAIAVVGALAAAAAIGMAYLAGSGESATARIIDGFKSAAGFVWQVVNSCSSLSDAFGEVTERTSNRFSDMFARLKTGAMETFTYIGTEIAKAFGEAGSYIMEYVGGAYYWIKEKLADLRGDTAGAAQAKSDRANLGKDEKQRRRDITSNVDSWRSDKFAKWENELKATTKGLEGKRNQQDQRLKDMAIDNKGNTLADQIKDGLSGIGNMFGLDKMTKMFEDISKLVGKTPAIITPDINLPTPAEKEEKEDKEKKKKEKKDKEDKDPTSTSFGDFFKKQMQNMTAGFNDIKQKQIQDQKTKENNARLKAEIQQQQMDKSIRANTHSLDLTRKAYELGVLGVYQ